MAYAVFDGAYTTVTATSAYVHDYGQKLTIVGLNLPSVVEAHFSRDREGTSVLRGGTCERGVATIPIPDAMLEEKGNFYCYIFGRSSESGRTQYEIKIPVTGRSSLPAETVDPSEEDCNYFASVIEEVTEQTDRILNGLSIGSVETLDVGEDATAAIRAEGDALLLDLGLPKGEGGNVGESTAGKTVSFGGADYTCKEGAECFNAYDHNFAVGEKSHAEGNYTKAVGDMSHAEGEVSTARGRGSHAEGVGTKATGTSSHSEGNGTEASGLESHAEGSWTIASGSNAHAEGGGTRATGLDSHAEGGGTTASGSESHAEGYETLAAGNRSHAEGTYTITSGDSQHVQGRYNIADSNYADIVGNGLSENNRSNAETTSWNGIKWLQRDVRCGGDDMNDQTAISLVWLDTKVKALEARIEALEGGGQ